MAQCPGDCACLKARRFSRETCEGQYQQAIRDIIADIQSRDPSEESQEVCGVAHEGQPGGQAKPEDAADELRRI